MAPETPRIYVDSCVFVNVFTGGAGDDDEQAWLPHGTWLLSEGQAGRVHIVTSPLTLAEVFGQGKIRGTHLPAADRNLRVQAARDYFQDNDILYVELDESLGDAAADLAVRMQLTGPDAIHLASSLVAECTTLYTWDKALLRCDGVDAIAGLTVRKPEIVGAVTFDVGVLEGES